MSNFFQNFDLPIVSRIQEWRQKRREEKRAWCLRIAKMRAELFVLAPANLDWQRFEALSEALEVASQLETYADLLFVELQGTFGGTRRASNCWQQLNKASYYFRLLRAEKVPYNAEQFRQNYVDAFWTIDTLMYEELRLTPQSDISECCMVSPWYITLLRHIMSVAA